MRDDGSKFRTDQSSSNSRGSSRSNSNIEIPDLPRPSLSRQVVALLMAVVLPIAGVWFLYVVGTAPGDGAEVAPVFAICLGLSFGLPGLFLLYGHLRNVFG